MIFNELVQKSHAMQNYLKQGRDKERKRNASFYFCCIHFYRYSTLLATIESLSLLLKVAQISSSRSLLSRLICSIEERMEQLNKLVQLSSSTNLRQQRPELNDDDFLSFRSALSSYEHLLTISSTS